MHRFTLRLAAVVAATVLTGCYTTRVQTGRPTDGQMFEDRQWFTIGGLAPLSGPSGMQCRNGVAMTESTMGGWDILINLGLTIGGGIAGGLACAGGDQLTQSYCSSLGASLIPFLIGSRTVRYACAAGPSDDGGGDRRYDSMRPDDPATPEREDLLAVAPPPPAR